MSAPQRSTFFRHTTVLFLLLAGGLSMVLFSVKYQVHGLEVEQKRLINELKDERRALHVLRAEWAYLNAPDRLQTLSRDYLGMEPINPHQIIDMEHLKLIPVRELNDDHEEGPQ